MKRRDKKPEIDVTNEDNDLALFRDSMQDVIPLRVPDKVIHGRKPIRPMRLRDKPQDNQSILKDSLSDQISFEIADGDEWSFLRPGLSRQTLRRLRRGHWGIQAYLDLHGFTSNEARSALVTFLHASSTNNFRCVCIIHGKGLSSKNREPVLKTRIGNWLLQREDILAFCQAKPEHGGSGALLVLLKSSNKQ